MRVRRKILKTLFVLQLVMSMTLLPVSATGQEMMIYNMQPRYNNIGSVALTIGFDTNNVVYCGLVSDMFNHGSGISGIMKLFDSNGTCLAVWSVSDYERPIGVEHTYQGVYGETYTCTFFGYAYSNNQTPPDELELSITGTCVDAD